MPGDSESEERRTALVEGTSTVPPIGGSPIAASTVPPIGAPSGKFLVMEHKTSSEEIGLGSTYWRRLMIDPQISLYISAVRAMGYDVVGVLYDILRKPDLRPFKATPVELRKYTKPTAKDPVSRLYSNQRERDETPEEYFDRCMAAIVEAPDKYYQRGVVTRLGNEIDEASRDVWQTATAMRDAKRLRIYPRNPDACVQWSRECDYLSVCCGEASIDDPLLFRVEPKKHSELDAVCDGCGEVGVTKSGLVRYDGWVDCDERSWLSCRRCGGSGQRQDLLTQSSLRTYRSCPRKYFYRYELQARPLTLDAAPLRTGKSVHGALEVWSKTGGDLQAGLAALSTDDPYVNAKERAMVIGYHARWGSPGAVVAVEKEWSMDLVNPDTGAASRTFRLGGRVDSIVRAT
jgi:hypothetical protein